MRISCIYAEKVKSDYTNLPNEFRIPIKHTKVSRKWLACATLKNSVRLSTKYLTLIFEKEKPINHGTRILDADQGMTTCLTLSDGQTTIKNKDWHDLTTILESITHQSKHDRKAFQCKKYGSHNFRRTQNHRNNYVNWAINQLNFSNVKEFRLEDINQIGHKQKKSMNKQHWCYSLIKGKSNSKCEELGIVFKEVPNEYNSQRCNKCGLVRSINRKGKTFKCTGCGNVTDADLNAASNLEIDLFEIPWWMRSLKINRNEGFYWKPNGIFSVSGEPISPPGLKSSFVSDRKISL